MSSKDTLSVLMNFQVELQNRLTRTYGSPGLTEADAYKMFSPLTVYRNEVLRETQIKIANEVEDDDAN